MAPIRKTLIYSSCILAFAQNACAVTYVVKKHDKLSTIALQFLGKPVWGDSGSLRKLLTQNPSIKNPDKIFPGSMILIESEIIKDNSKISVIEQSPVLPPSAVASDGSATYLDIIPFYGMREINSTDRSNNSKAVIGSGLDLGIEGRFYQIWDKRSRSFIRGSLNYVALVDPTNATRSLDTKSKFLSGFGLGGLRNLTDSVSFGLSADLKQELFTRAKDSKSVVVDSVIIPSLGTQIIFDIAKKSAFKISLSGLYDYKFAASANSYDVHSGHQLGANLGVTTKKDLNINLGIQQRNQDTTATTQTDRRYFLSITLPISLGDDK